LILIPAGVAHGCQNLGSAPAHIIYFVDRQFDPAPGRCDENRLPWDYWGESIWNNSRE